MDDFLSDVILLESAVNGFLQGVAGAMKRIFIEVALLVEECRIAMKKFLKLLKGTASAVDVTKGTSMGKGGVGLLEMT